MENKGGIIFLGVMLAFALVMPIFLKSRQPAAYQLVPVRRKSVYSPVPQFIPATYENEEEWNVEYTPEGLVKRVIVHRRAQQV